MGGGELRQEDAARTARRGDYSQPPPKQPAIVIAAVRPAINSISFAALLIIISPVCFIVLLHALILSKVNDVCNRADGFSDLPGHCGVFA